MAVVEQDPVVLGTIKNGPLEVGLPFGQVDPIEFWPGGGPFNLQRQEAPTARDGVTLSEGPPANK